jgi:hypothetical protein
MDRNFKKQITHSLLLPTAVANAILSPILLSILSRSLKISNSKIYHTKITQS